MHGSWGWHGGKWFGAMLRNWGRDINLYHRAVGMKMLRLSPSQVNIRLEVER